MTPASTAGSGLDQATWAEMWKRCRLALEATGLDPERAATLCVPGRDRRLWPLALRMCELLVSTARRARAERN